MDVFEAMAKRRSVRKYLADPVEEGDLDLILEAGRMAASWANTQCWEIVVVRDHAIKAQLFKQGQATTVHGDWMLFDVALFLSNVTHAAYALGYGTVHVGLFDHAAAGRALRAPDGVRVIELMPIGRPAGPPREAPPRREVEEFVHRDGFGR
jgi:nitroreductase